MKKSLVLLLFAIGFAFSFTACSDDEETCYECVYANFANCTVDICDGEATFNGTCPIGSVGTTGLDNDQIRDVIEMDPDATCTAK